MDADKQRRLTETLDTLNNVIADYDRDGGMLAELLWGITGPSQAPRDVVRRWLRHNYPRR